MRTLVVVGQRAKARLFLHQGAGSPLAEVTDLAHPASRAHGTELASDRPGRVHERVGPTRHAMAQEETPKEREAANFAREVAATVEAARTRNELDRLILVAEPGFLGMLRAALDPVSARLVDAEVRRELTDHSVADIAEHLAEHLRIG